MQTRIYLLFFLCISTSYLLAQNTIIKPDKACINCQIDTLEARTLDRLSLQLRCHTLTLKWRASKSQVWTI